MQSVGFLPRVHSKKLRPTTRVAKKHSTQTTTPPAAHSIGRPIGSRTARKQ